MILTKIRNYLQGRGAATLGEIARHLGSEPAAVQGMLQVWIEKGRVRRHQPTGSCGSSCTQCDPSAIEIYEWLEPDGKKSSMELPVSVPGHCPR